MAIPIFVKLRPFHTVLNNAPATQLISSDQPVNIQRVFTGHGAPSATTLQPGNGRYNGTTGGFVIDASLVAPGAGYNATYVMPVNGGTFTQAPNITVDLVTAAGSLVDFRLTLAGNYSIYPVNPCATTAGTGAGATFNLAIPFADRYIDISTPGSPVEYLCQAGGTNATSTWNKISGTGGGNATMARVTTIFGDYLQCVIWNGANNTTGDTILVAKPPNLRRSVVAENIDSDAVTYDYTLDASGFGNDRTANDGTNTEIQVMRPQYIIAGQGGETDNQDIISCEISTSSTGVPQVDAIGVFWIEIKPARHWASRYKQS